MAKKIDDFSTVIVNGELPKSWKCPCCGCANRLTRGDNEIFMRYMQFIRHCERCGTLHFWKLHLTDEFAKAVVQMLMDDDRRNEEESLREY